MNNGSPFVPEKSKPKVIVRQIRGFEDSSPFLNMEIKKLNDTGFEIAYTKNYAETVVKVS